MDTTIQGEEGAQLTLLGKDIKLKTSLLNIAEKALKDVSALCVSSVYWKNDKYQSCARILAHHHKIVTNAQVEIATIMAIEYGDDVEA